MLGFFWVFIFIFCFSVLVILRSLSIYLYYDVLRWSDFNEINILFGDIFFDFDLVIIFFIIYIKIYILKFVNKKIWNIIELLCYINFRNNIEKCVVIRNFFIINIVVDGLNGKIFLYI